MQVWALAAVANWAARAGQRDRTQPLAQQVKKLARTEADRPNPAPALLELVEALARIGGLDHAEALAHSLSSPYFQSQALTKVLARTPRSDRAQILAKQAQAAARQSGNRLRPWALTALAAATAKLATSTTLER